MKLSRKPCWVVRDPSKIGRGPEKGSHVNNYQVPPQYGFCTRGGGGK